MWKCPHCEIELEHGLNYSVSTRGSEYGTAYLRKNKPEHQVTHNTITDWDIDDSGDTEWDGDPTFTCPECSEKIEIQELIWINKIEEKPTPPQEEFEEMDHIIIKPQNEITKESDTIELTDSIIICKKCFHNYISYRNERHYDNYEDIFCECPKCGEVNSTEEFKRLLKKEFFNNTKYDPTKKIKHRPLKFMVKSKPKIYFKIQRHQRIIKKNSG